MKLESSLLQGLFVYVSKGLTVDPTFGSLLSKHGAVVSLNLNKRVGLFCFISVRFIYIYLLRSLML